jgi:site-specific recombinase XerD
LEAVRCWKSSPDESKRGNLLSIQQAGEDFLADAKSRQLVECTIYKYRLLFKQLGSFAKKHGLRFMEELDLARLGQFRSEWKDGPRSSLKKLERLRAFFRFCERRKWIFFPFD